jgi:hypothetical protein
MSSAALLALAPWLHRQHGVVTVAQADAAGVDRRALRELRGRGLLVPEQGFVLRCALVPRAWETRAMAALLAAGPAAGLGRWAAARVHGFVGPRRQADTELDLLQPRRTNVRDVVPRPRRCSALAASDLVEVAPFRCTSVAWTLVDLALVGRPATVERLVARALADGEVTEAQLAGVVERLRGRQGVARARAVLGIVEEVVVGTRSRPESTFVRAVVAAGLPRPVVDHRVVDGAGSPRFLDAAWVEWGVAAEIDVHGTHATTIGRRADGRRQNDLVLDWLVLRFDERDLVTDLDGVVRQVEAALRRAGWRPSLSR